MLNQKQIYIKNQSSLMSNSITFVENKVNQMKSIKTFRTIDFLFPWRRNYLEGMMEIMSKEVEILEELDQFNRRELEYIKVDLKEKKKIVNRSLTVRLGKFLEKSNVKTFLLASWVISFLMWISLNTSPFLLVGIVLANCFATFIVQAKNDELTVYKQLSNLISTK